MPENSKKSLAELIASEPDKVKRMALIDFDMGMFKDPDDAFLNFNVSEGTYMRYAEARIKALAKVISEHTGADPEQIINPETRTPEQQQLIFELSGREQMNRIHAYLASNYLEALRLIKQHADESGDNIYAAFWDVDRDETTSAGSDEPEPVHSIPRLAALYYFALHTEINARDKGAFDDADKRDELLQIFDRMDTFYRANRDFLQTDQAIAAAFIEADNPANADKIIKVVTRKIDSLEYPVDKVNHSIWGLLEEQQQNGQIKLHMEKKGRDKDVITLYAIDFSKVEELIKASGGKITRALTKYDKRVCIAAASLYNSGQTVFSLRKLYSTMGNLGNPGKNDFAKMEAAIKKLEGAIIMLNNQGEVDAGYKYPKFKYYGSLMPLEFVKAEIDGVTVDAAIHLFREPPVITFAKQRKQCTTVNLKMLQSPISKTENALGIEDYLIERIARAKDEHKRTREILNKLQRIKADKRTDKDEQRIDELKAELQKPERFLLDTILDNAGITGAKARQRAAETITRFLDYYRKNGDISDFTRDKKGYSITF